jgi:exopolysaccharide biosynthesis polyprenyl glycosylphosphotransferase
VQENILKEQLFNRYAKGGTWFAGIRASTYFIFKKYSWQFVIGSALILKRLLDIIISIIMLIILSPLFMLTALVIRIDDRGPVIFSQTRVGRKGKRFTIYKFRSMEVRAEEKKDHLMDLNESGSIIFKIKEDPRFTRIGKIIRKTSIDELPQLWNVLKGNMSLVGPRPPVPNEVEKYGYRDLGRLDVKPGLTCIWQVSGRSNIDFEGQVKLDLQYIESQSFWTDIKLLFKTVPAVLLGRGAY